MLPLTVPTICLSLAAGALAVTSDRYTTGGGSYPATPDVTVSAPSRMACSAKCTALEEWRCGGFRYLANGTCLLYREARFETAGTPPPEGSTSSDQPAIYHRPAQSACSGNASSPCGCPEGFSRCAGRCLQRLDAWTNYTRAEKACAELGAHLATPRSEEEQQCAAAAVSSFTWLGYRGGRTEESFVGADGCGAITYRSWADGEPNLNNDDNCVDMDIRRSWFDYSCSNALPSGLCQLQSCYRPECIE